MNQNICIRHWQDLPERPQGVAVVFDILRCSTTIQCLKNREVKNLWVAPSLASVAKEPTDFLQTLSVFSELKSQLLCRQRFDNSPELASIHGAPDAPTIVSTTTGTPAMFAARQYERVYVGSIVGFSQLIQTLKDLNRPITLIPAALTDSGHVEDLITAQAVATALDGFSDLPEFVTSCAQQALQQIHESKRPLQLAAKLSTGPQDVAIALDLDRFTTLPYLQFTSDNLARVY